MKDVTSITLIIILSYILGVYMGFRKGKKDIVSNKLIDPYKIEYTKVDGKIVKTFYYRQD